MVLLPCSNCCEPCTCPTCGCCQCDPGGADSWQAVFDMQQRSATAPYSESYYKELYDDLVALLPGCITRLYESQSACVDAKVAQALIDNPGMTEAEIRAAFQSTWEEQDCQNYISLISPNTWHGWSVPYINGNVATTAALAEQCPNGSPPSPLLCSPGQTTYWGIPKWVGDGTRVPDIRQLVLTDPATGDPVADALFAVGSQLGAINLGGGEWSFEIDCTDCDGNVETDCNSASRLDAVWYEKTVEVRESRPDPCNSATDELDLCPPQNCTIVAITVTRKKYCGSNANEITQEDSWTVEVAVCPCAFPFIMTTSDPIASEARGYASEADCVADWTCGGSAATACGNNQWKLVRHDTEPNGSDRQCMTYECESVTGCYPPFGCCG